MPGMWLHVVAAVLMVAHLVVASAAGRPRLAALCADVVMTLGMLDMAAGSRVLAPVGWFGISILTALVIAASRGRGRGGSACGRPVDGAAVQSSLALVLMGTVQLVAMPHELVESSGAHHQAITLIPVVLIGLTAHVAVCVVAALRTRTVHARACRLLLAAAAMAMGAALVIA